MRSIFLIGVICLLNTFLHSQVKITSLYFIKNSDDLVPSSKIEASNLINLMDGFFVQIIEINSFSDGGTESICKKIAGERIEYIVDTFKLERNVISINNFGLNREKVPFEILNWERVDIYYYVGKKRKKIIEVTEQKEKSKESNSVNSRIKLDTTLNTNRPVLPYFSSIKFIGGTDLIKAESLPIVTSLKDTLINNPNLTLRIHGHVCCDDNKKLSKQRAKAIRNYLIDEGVHSRRLSCKGFSNTQPLVCPELTNSDRELNRRVDVIFTNNLIKSKKP